MERKIDLIFPYGVVYIIAFDFFYERNLYLTHYNPLNIREHEERVFLICIDLSFGDSFLPA